MWFLWIFGNIVEDAMGSLRFVLLYILCGFAAVAALVMLYRIPELLQRHPYYGWKKRAPTANWHRVDKRWRE